MLQTTNYLELTFWAKSQNESFARSAVGAFFSQLNPTLEELDDLKTAVSERHNGANCRFWQGHRKR